MSVLPLLDPANATGPAGPLLETVRRRLGVVPNMTRAMANSPALLEGYLGLSGALEKGVLSAATREQIALAVAQGNRCDYCLSAHTYLAEHVAHLDAQAIAEARKGASADLKTAAVLRLAVAVNDTRGDVDETELTAAREAGLSDGEIAEIIGHVALNVLTNYFNKVADVDIDFPQVRA